MLPPAALNVADRLITALMTLFRAVAPSDAFATTPLLPEAAAQSLFFRLSQLIIGLIRISHFGVRTPTKPNLAEDPDHLAPAAPPSRPTRPRAASLPRRPGWLLAALPEIAPLVAADLSALLADPAIAALLDLAPSLHRTLRPILRALGLDAPPLSPPRPTLDRPAKTPPAAPIPPLRTGPEPRHHVKKRLPNTQPFRTRFVSIS